MTGSKKWKSKSFFGLSSGFGANDVTDFVDVDVSVSLRPFKASRLSVTDDAIVDIGSEAEHVGDAMNATRRTSIKATIDMMTILKRLARKLI